MSMFAPGDVVTINSSNVAVIESWPDDDSGFFVAVAGTPERGETRWNGHTKAMDVQLVRRADQPEPEPEGTPIEPTTLVLTAEAAGTVESGEAQ